jgi:outer membrane protein TolC
MLRNWRFAFTASILGLVHGAGAARGQTPPVPPALPDAPGANVASPANIAFDIQMALASQPTSGPQGVPINLAAALRLAGANPLDIAAASARLDQALGLLIQAKALKIPNLNGGLGYYRHDGTNQNLFTGQAFQKGTNAIQLGGGPTINLALTDAIFAPLAAKRVVGARRADVQAARNDVLNTVAQFYFNLQEAKGRLVGAEATIVRAESLVRFAEGLAPSLIAPLEINRSRAQLENVRQFRETTLNDWRVAGAQLAEILLLEPTILLDPIEPPFLRVAVVPTGCPTDELVRIALGTRPEIASQRELLLAAEQQLRREKSRPLLPNLVLSTPGTANAGVLPAGEFYSGANGSLNGSGGRADFSAAIFWQLSNGGLGNLGLVKQRKGERRAAEVEVTRTLFRVRSEVSQALSRVQTSDARVPRAEIELREAIQSADKNFVGLRETTRPAGELLNLVIRPQEVVASLQALNQAFQDYSSAVSTFNRAQFELYRALGRPAQWVTSLQKSVVAIGPEGTGTIPPATPPVPGH